MTSADCTPEERLAVFISRQIKDGEQVIAGTNLEAPRAALLLAHWSHAPNLRLQLGGYMANLSEERQLERFSSRADFDRRGAPGLEAHVPLDFENLWRVDLTFIGGLQVDGFGNTNLIGLKRAGGGFKMRGPGTVGVASLTTFVRRYFIFLTEHSPRVLVPKCDFISSVGWAKGGADARAKLGLPGGGPQFLTTPLCVMDFDPDTKRARLLHLQPGVSAEQVRAETGFPLAPGPAPEPLPSPTDEELLILRERVDPGGRLRRAAKQGP
jgi:glutaconate CoA-transferase, subunit B